MSGAAADLPPIALVTYSSKPRGGVVHTLCLAEALHAMGAPVRVIALGDPKAGFFRPVAAPVTIVPAPENSGNLEEKVTACIDRLTRALADTGAALLHTQDCIAARAAARVRDAGAKVRVLRTVHHVDDFTSSMLMDCQRAAILEPDDVLVVSRMWQQILRDEYGVATQVVPNGVDVARFSTPPPGRAEQLRARVGATGRPLLLAVGGVEPRKGSDTLIRALAELANGSPVRPVLAVLGGHSFQDHRAYRERVLAEVPALGLRFDDDVHLVGTVPADDMPAWYAAADLLAFPSVKEGFGLAVLEAMSAGLPVVTSDLPVFREYLVGGRDALLTPVDDVGALAAALRRVLGDEALAQRLRRNGRACASRFTWERSALRHLEVYRRAAGAERRGPPALPEVAGNYPSETSLLSDTRLM
jgi:glycosyltransferase-like protein